MKIAVNFDGTIVENNYPEIGKEKPFAFYVLLNLIQRGHKLILCTHRTGEELQKVIEYCRERDLEFYAVNDNRFDEKCLEGLNRQIDADIFIDSRNLGGLPSWDKIFWIIHPQEADYVSLRSPSRKWKRWKRWRKKQWRNLVSR